MKRYLRILASILACLILLCGCNDPAPAAKADTDDAPAEPKADSLTVLKDWLDADFSFEISLEYNYFPYFGITQETLHEFASDGSIHHITSREQWNAGKEYPETREYYYRYEGSDYVCYMRIDDEEPTRSVMSAKGQKEMADSLEQLVGAKGLLPNYMQDFQDAGLDDENGYQCYTFDLPLADVYDGESLISVLVRSAYTMSGIEYDPKADILIGCTFETEPDTLRPVRVTYDLTEFKPIVLSDGVLSAEYALGFDAMYLIYEFDYDLAQTFSVPKDFIP